MSELYRLKIRLGRGVIRFAQRILMLMLDLFYFTRVDRSKYSVIVSGAFYSPWISDCGFQKTYSRLREFTLVDEYRAYELWHLIGQVKQVRGDVIEVGVWRGGSGCLMAERCRREDLDATILLCDTFEGVVKTGQEDSTYRDGRHADTSQETVEQLIERESFQNVQILKGVFPDETGDEVQDRVFRLCHIDVDVYQSAKDIFDWIWGRMSIGGVVVFDDYGGPLTNGVTKLVNEEASGPDRLMVHNVNGHALIIRTR